MTQRGKHRLPNPGQHRAPGGRRSYRLTVAGTTAYAEGDNACLRETGMYFPPNHSFGSTKLNVVLWMHGFYVHSARDLLHGIEPAPLPPLSHGP